MTIAEFKKTMTDSYISDTTVKEKYSLVEGNTFDEQFSAVSIENIIFSIVATAMWVMQQLFNQHTTDVSAILNSQTPGTPNWYAYMSKKFQYGMELVEGTDTYDNSALTAEQITALQIVKYAAAVEAADRSILYIKVATDIDGVRSPLTIPQLVAFKRYLNDVQYAGVRIEFINDSADLIKLNIDIYYDQLVMDNSGSMLDGSSDTPIQDAIRSYLSNLPFNGTYTNQALVDTLQAISGVDIAEIKSVASKYGAYEEYTAINAREIAHAGYYAIPDANLTLTFIPNEELL